MKTYYNKGIVSSDEELNKKILRDAKICWWHDEVDQSFTGYILEEKDEKSDKIIKKYYDICGLLARRDWKKEEQRDIDRHNKFVKIHNAVIKSTDEINKFSNKLDQITEIKTKLNSICKKIKRGWVQDNNKIGGSKRRRRYKKDNRRFLTDDEIKNLKQDKEYYENFKLELSEKLDLEKFLYETISRMYGIKKNTIGAYNLKYGYHKTEGIYIIYELRLQSLKEKINHIAYNDLVEKERKNSKIKNKDNDKDSDSDSDSEEVEISKINRKNIKVFEENFEKVFSIVQEEKENYTVTRERQVTNRAKFFIDRNGNRVELGSNVNQVVLHN